MNNSGIIYSDPALPNGGRVSLPLEGLDVRVIIVDVSARVAFTQTYSNSSDIATNRCKYYFPVPAGAAICAFHMRTDKRTITGISKEKELARQEYEEALQTEGLASMLDYVTDDIFVISVGSIPAHTTVETKVVYVMSLQNHDNSDEIQFRLPMCVGERYGTSPPELRSALMPSSRTRIRLTAEIQTSGKIDNITSPSHQQEIMEMRYPTHIGRLSRRRSTVKFRSRSFLNRDFILIIQADGLDSPRCFAEIQHDSEGRNADTIAMQLIVIPKFNLPPISAQEYFFVVDRSGSMNGPRIETAKNTLMTLLRILPSRNTIFNIFSFGSNSTSLWQRSSTYNQVSMDHATSHVECMEADYGGTEIASALRFALSSRSTALPTAVFVLTDGEVNDLNNETVSIIQKFVQKAPTHAPLRVFTLGIGNVVSTAMCEGIARAGNGVCLFAPDTENILGKCARLLRAGRTPFVENVAVNWGVPMESSSSNTSVQISDNADTAIVVVQTPLVVQQAPTEIQDIHAGTRMNVFAILTPRRMFVPKTVTLYGNLDGDGAPFELTIPIKGVQLVDSEPGSPLIHSLAAWKLIQEHEQSRAPLPQAIGAITDHAMRKAIIIQLGEQYQIASRYTSFVAVDSGSERTRPSRIWHTFAEIGGTSRKANPTGGGVSSGSSQSTIRIALQSFLTGIFNLGFRTSRTSRPGVPGAWPDSPGPSPPASQAGEDSGDHGTVTTFSTLSSLEGSSIWSDWSEPPNLQPVSVEEAERQRSASPISLPIHLAPDALRRQILPDHKVLPDQSPSQQPMKPEVTRLLRSQKFDGSFLLNGLEEIMGLDAVNEAAVLQVDGEVWATVLYVAFITKHMADQKELLGDLLVKAMEFLQARRSIDIGGLVHHASQLIV